MSELKKLVEEIIERMHAALEWKKAIAPLVIAGWAENLEAALAAERMREEQVRQLAVEIGNLSHMAWLDRKNAEEIFKSIEQRAQAIQKLLSPSAPHCPCKINPEYQHSEEPIATEEVETGRWHDKFYEPAEPAPPTDPFQALKASRNKIPTHPIESLIPPAPQGDVDLVEKWRNQTATLSGAGTICADELAAWLPAHDERIRKDAEAKATLQTLKALTEEDVACAYQSAPNWHGVLSSLQYRVHKASRKPRSD